MFLASQAKEVGGLRIWSWIFNFHLTDLNTFWRKKKTKAVEMFRFSTSNLQLKESMIIQGCLGTSVLWHCCSNLQNWGKAIVGTVTDKPHKEEILWHRRDTLLLTCHYPPLLKAWVPKLKRLSLLCGGKWHWKSCASETRCPENWRSNSRGAGFHAFRMFPERVSDHLPSKLRINNLSPNVLFYRRKEHVSQIFKQVAKTQNNIPHLPK